MAYLLSFSKDDKELFEAFWVGYKPMDLPKFGAEVKTSISFENDVKAKTVEGGSIRLAHCPGCSQRVAQYPNLRTLRDGEGADFILEQDDFSYIKARFAMWERVFDELREPFLVLSERFDAMKPKSYSEWQRFIAERDSPPIP